MAVYSIDKASRAYKEGIIQKYQQLFYKPFSEEARPTQCFKCQRQGHTQKHYRTRPTCSNYGTMAHLQVGEAYGRDPRCSNCGGKHLVRSRDCPIGKQAQQRAKLAYENRPRAYKPPAQRDLASAPPPFLFTMPSQSMIVLQIAIQCNHSMNTVRPALWPSLEHSVGYSVKHSAYSRLG